VHGAGGVHCRCNQCSLWKSYERFGFVLASRVRLILKLDIYPERQWANAPYSRLLVVDTVKGPFSSLFETPLPEED